MRIRCTSKNALLSCTKKAFCARSSARPLKGQLGVCLPRGPRFRRMPIGANLFGNVPAPHFIIVITRFPPFFAGKTREGRERERGRGQGAIKTKYCEHARKLAASRSGREWHRHTGKRQRGSFSAGDLSVVEGSVSQKAPFSLRSVPPRSPTG